MKNKSTHHFLGLFTHKCSSIHRLYIRNDSFSTTDNNALLKEKALQVFLQDFLEQHIWKYKTVEQ